MPTTLAVSARTGFDFELHLYQLDLRALISRKHCRPSASTIASCSSDILPSLLSFLASSMFSSTCLMRSRLVLMVQYSGVRSSLRTIHESIVRLRFKTMTLKSLRTIHSDRPLLAAGSGAESHKQLWSLALSFMFWFLVLFTA